MYPTLKYLLYLIEYLSDENFGKLLHLFYGHYSFFPHDKWSNKELFLNILLYKRFPICELNVDKNQFIQDAYYCLVLLQNKNWKALENAKETNSYYKIHNFLLNNEKLSESLITDQKHLNTLYLEYEKIRRTYENTENYLIECINYIILSINSYNLNIEIPSKTFKTFLNKYIENMCQYLENLQNEEYKNYRGYCYIINDNSIEKIIFSHDNTIKKEKYPLKEEENILKLTNNQGCEKIIKNYNKICNDNKDRKNNIFALKGSKDFKRVKNINAALDEAITEYKKTMENNMDFCHICNPIYLNENHKKLKGQGHLKQMCSNCKRMFYLIQEISKNDNGKIIYETKYIRERIKLRNSTEQKMTPDTRKERHLERLLELLIEIMEKLERKKKDDIKIQLIELEKLVNSQFYNNNNLQKKYKHMHERIFK